jgi:EAL domain-containing protein (putative c-di-GMP-specific phosphodiesterase class I)/GGDEF domain-containing protein
MLQFSNDSTAEGSPRNEAGRLEALHRLHLLDTPPAEAYDRITRTAAQVFRLPIAAISFTDADRQWFKSRVGVEHRSIPREGAPCAQVAESKDLLIIPDLLADACFRDSHLARSGIRFYAGAPLTTPDGHCLGAMCVLGTEPRQASAEEMTSLTDLATMVMSQIELQHVFGRVDPLSQLPNRTQFLEDFDDLVHSAPLGERRLAVLVELANPEQMNNAVRVMGSSYLDRVIAEAATTIQKIIGPGRKLYHVATTQFAFIALPGVEDRAYAQSLQQWMDEIEKTPLSRFLSTTVLGIAPFNVGVTGCRDLLRMTHSAVQEAMAAGHSVGVYSADKDAAFRRQFALHNDFAEALESTGQLRLVYQPRIDLATRRCVAVEALLRWKHPVMGDIPPGEFIPLIERTTLARPMTAWVIESAMAQLTAWRARGIVLGISVNVSTSNLIETDLAGRIQEGLSRHDIEPARLELEVTESAMMDNPEKALATLEELAGLGIGLAIDDFGTGHSSLAYLERLPVHVVKIDQSFMANLETDARKQLLVSTMISFTHDLGYRVVVEGVETESVLDLVSQMKCVEAQGYLFGRPMAPEAFDSWHGEEAARHATPA